MSAFAAKLATGQLGESLIARWCMSRGNSIIPVYEKEIDTGKGPRFFTPEGQFVAPDMFMFPSMMFIEAKHKTVFSWHRVTSRWCTGIDLNHYAGYQKVQDISGRPVWLLFLHRSPIPHERDLLAGSPDRCPVGLFGEDLRFLAENENHRHGNWGRHGMVYWAADKLKLLAPIEAISELAA